MRRAAIRAASQLVTRPPHSTPDGDEGDENDEDNDDLSPDLHSAADALEEGDDEGDEDESEDDDDDDDDGEEGDEEDEEEEDDGEEEYDPNATDEDDAAPPLNDDLRVPPTATHWTLRRMALRHDGVWVSDGPQLTHGQVDGLPIQRWPLDQWNPHTILRRWGPGHYMPVFIKWDRAKERFFIAGKGRRFTLYDPKQQPGDADAPATPHPPRETPQSFATQVMGPPIAHAPPSPVVYPTPSATVLGWDAESARYLADISPEMRGQLAAMRLLQDDQERRARIAIEGERERARQHLEVMQMQQRTTLELFALALRPQQVQAPPAPAPAPAPALAAAMPDLSGIATIIAQVQALAQQAQQAPPMPMPAAEIIPSAADEAQQQADRTTQLVVAGASIIANLAEVAKAVAPMFAKAAPTAEAAAAAAAAAVTP